MKYSDNVSFCVFKIIIIYINMLYSNVILKYSARLHILGLGIRIPPGSLEIK
jgi:hypothetical protein